MLKLYGYFRSSAVYRTRIALNLKGLDYQKVYVHLRKGEQFDPSYMALNPQALVPAFEDGQHILTQSLAIIEYLDETCPEPPLLPGGPKERARIRALALSIACDIHPLNNLKVLTYLSGTLGIGDDQKNDWYRHWIALGFQALEAQLSNDPATGKFCHGDQPTLADVCLVPQVNNARIYECDLTPYPTVTAIERACLELAQFQDARPENQPDAVSG